MTKDTKKMNTREIEETARQLKAEEREQASEDTDAVSEDIERDAGRDKKLRRRKPKAVADTDDVIIMDNVTKSYSFGAPALNGVSLRVKRGEFVFIVGDSGSGKSTLIKLLLRELEATSGSVNVMGYNLNRIRHGQIPKFRRKLGIVFQDFRLLKDRNVFENVAFAQRVVQTPSNRIRSNVTAMLSLVGLASKYKHKVTELSGGEQQRVALARALVNKPDVLLADEPTGNLDPGNSWEIMKLMDRINKKGTTVIVVTHNREIVNSMRKRVITMNQGVIVEDVKEG